eukprot:COSAG02_NODE_1078_length_14712_cov_9.462054_3_plen_55_part_00
MLLCSLRAASLAVSLAPVPAVDVELHRAATGRGGCHTAAAVAGRSCASDVWGWS